MPEPTLQHREIAREIAVSWGNRPFDRPSTEDWQALIDAFAAARVAEERERWATFCVERAAHYETKRAIEATQTLGAESWYRARKVEAEDIAAALRASTETRDA